MSSKDKKPIEKIYQKKSQLEHILLRPDTYIGSIEPQKDKLWVFDIKEKRLVFKEISYVPGLYKIFDEILVNAADNYQRDKNMSFIKVSIDQNNKLISIKNDGIGIPVVIHKEYDIYVPELIFGNLLTSSNYDDNEKKVVGGRNGFGAKLTNIFSKKFQIETSDKKNGKKFKQTYKNNMSIKEPFELSKNEKEDYTSITFEPDLDKFRMETLDDDITSLMVKRVYDMAGTTPNNVKVFLNGEKLDLKNFSTYIDMFLSCSQNEEEQEIKKVYEKVNEFWEVGMSLSDGQFQQVSYVNAICTSKGGTHVNYVADQIIEYVMEVIKKKKKSIQVKNHQIKQHLWIFVNSLIVNPSFDSQTKDTLTLKSSSFGSTCPLTEKFLKNVINTGIVEHVSSFAKAREDLKFLKNLNAGGKKLSRMLGIPKLEDANMAGSKNSHLCTLILTEGDSAKSLAMSGIEVVGRDIFGVFPLKGKLLNVRDANQNQIMNNDEIQNLIKIIGLTAGKSYTDNKCLRYGSVMIMTDQDTDGSHIKGLIINFIHHFWPSLIMMNGFLKEFITPIIKVSKGTIVKSFYTIPEYKQWADSIDNIKSWKIKYYKGLGTSSDKEAIEYFKNIDKSRIDFEYLDEDDDTHIDLVFNKKKTEDRKRWLGTYDINNTLQNQNFSKIRYMDFINKEFIMFSIADNERSIPSVSDGLKPSERKILFSCFKRKLKDEIKVAQLSGYVSEHSAYHHGEQSLCSTIVAMAQNFVGSNNINLLQPLGQFGTRNQGGKDSASARYIFTNLSKVARHIFNENDDPLMEYILEEGQKIEPHWYLPIIPMILVNGAEGIGTGWSTSIPCYNPREIISSLRNKIKTGSFIEIHPWYKGYQGKIEKNLEVNSSYIVSGKYLYKPEENIVIITELPIKKWTKEYKKLFEKYMGIKSKDDKEKKVKTKKKKKEEAESDDNKEEKIILEDFKEYHSGGRVHFELKITKELNDEFINDESKIMKVFKLTSSISVNNLVCFDSQMHIKKYKNIDEIMEEFYFIRLQFYEKRKEHMLSQIYKDLEIFENKVRFILAVINEEIIIRKVKKKDLLSLLINKNFAPMSKINSIVKRSEKVKESQILEVDNEDINSEEEKDCAIPAKEYEYLLGMPLWNLTYEKVQDLQNQRDQKRRELDLLKSTSTSELWLRDMDKFLETLQTIEDIEEEERLSAIMEGDKQNKKKRNKKEKKEPNDENKKKKKNKKMEDEDFNKTTLMNDNLSKMNSKDIILDNKIQNKIEIYSDGQNLNSKYSKRKLSHVENNPQKDIYKTNIVK